MLHLNFDSDHETAQNDQYATRRFRDISGNDILVDCQSAWSANGMLFNQCPVRSLGPDGSSALAFSSSGLCDRAGDYLSVAKRPELASLQRGTIAFFENRSDPNNFNHEIIDSYRLFAPRTYKLHRDGDAYVTFTVNTDGGRETDLLTFPTGGALQAQWNHYAISWDGTSVKGYFNGVYFGEAPMRFISSLDVQHYLAIGAMMHGEPRNTPDGGNCVSQYGFPAGDYVFPNAGFLTSSLDDVRIYNRVLTEGEISALAGQNKNPAAEFVVSVSKSGDGFGTVLTTDLGGNVVAGVGCGKHCAETVVASGSVGSAQRRFLKAIPYEGSRFAGWTGDCSGTAPCEISFARHTTATAQFVHDGFVLASFEAEDGILSGPFEVSEGAIVQRQSTGTSIALAGRAAYPFTVSVAGEYLVAGIVNVPSQSANSFYVTIGAPQIDPTSDNVWHISTTGGFDERFVSWGGSTSGGNIPRVFSLTPGNYHLILRGREPNTAIDKLLILRKPSKENPSKPFGLKAQAD